MPVHMYEGAHWDMQFAHTGETEYLLSKDRQRYEGHEVVTSHGEVVQVRRGRCMDMPVSFTASSIQPSSR
jgi:hypothetical protein